MVSRRKILSRSRDELNTIRDYPEDDEDVWYLKESLYKDHLQEVLQKWEQLDDEIWSKIICMERNRRIAKAYARAEELTINGSDEGFNGYRIGLNGFENPMRDAKTAEMKRYIGNGIRLKMDDNGNVLAKRSCRSNVYVMDVENKREDHSIGAEITKNGGEMSMNKAMKLFDMKRFQSNIDKELHQGYPDRRKLENQCIISISFVGRGHNMLDSPCWVMIINVVALDMLKRKLPTAPRYGGDKKIYSRPRLPIPFEEDPYSLPGNVTNGSSSNSNGIYSRLPNRDSKPPKLPPRDFNSKKKLMTVPEPDYEDRVEEKPRNNKKRSPVKKISKIEDEDPYYCGMLARVPNYNNKKREQQHHATKQSSRYASRNGAYDIYGYAPRQQTIYASGMPYNTYGSSLYRSVDSLIDSHNRHEEIYSHIYGSRLRMPTAAPAMPFKSSRSNAYVGNWE